MDAGSIDCVVTSPPYWQTRDYEGAPGQLGQEAAVEEHIEALREVFAAARDVMVENGSLWLNLGDRYATSTMPRRCRNRPAKQLLGIPWRVALAPQADGWILRNETIRHKPKAVPESRCDRLARHHEHLLFFFTRPPAYHFDLDPIHQPYTGDRALSRPIHRSASKPHAARGIWPKSRSCSAVLGPSCQPTGVQSASPHPKGRNPGTVWTIPTRPGRLPHTAAVPLDLQLRCIAAGCRLGGDVLDPFSGTATAGVAAFQRIAQCRLEVFGPGR
ncbi:DNA-methyltransferase [Streptomyces sp. NPDC058000]|uniref:DNA-methyltransferase n=1 Tax=Streptomyces sp. NPDC058000 TaxID=3346299 RepID=UPI0036E08DCE